jgi:thiamine pyridinylase
MRREARWLWLGGAVLLWACGGDLPPPSGGEEKITLRVPIYPYIPDAAGDEFKALKARIEAEFEAAHPDIDLVINPSCFADDFYEPAGIASSLTGGSDCAYDVIETDTAILSELVASGAVRSWPRMPEGISFHPAGLMASTGTPPAAQVLYGVPHWLCNHFIVSRSESVRQARTTPALVQALAALGTPEPDTAVDMLGSWNLPSLYLDGWADRHGGEELRSAVTTANYDSAVLQSMHGFVRTCEADGQNPCIDGTYNQFENFDLPAQLFAQGKVDSTLGYSERLHTIIKNLPANATISALRISSAPLGGQGSNPILFTDSYFLSARCTGDCEKAALAFTEYMSQPSTFEWILMSEDAPAVGRVPRYLLPATLDAYEAPKVSVDPFYPVLAAETRNGVPFPNGGLLNIRRQMEADIKAVLSSP